jgi:centrosomal protein CEP104
LGARIWIATHSENWRQRAAAVQAVLDFSQNQLPERYSKGNTRNLFLALMEFARINAEDKVLQIYYTSLKIATIALAPPICGDDVPVALINKSLQKLMPILIDKSIIFCYIHSFINQRPGKISLSKNFNFNV